jgi:hypothetical protein
MEALEHSQTAACEYPQDGGFEEVFYQIVLPRSKEKAFDAKDYSLFLFVAFTGRMLRLSRVGIQR